ncbi:MAG TPA: ABC transporter permease [Leeuwenhoekiella sp.]|nr:ABC transporter permease [Leeuwenhoekiella sp.]
MKFSLFIAKRYLFSRSSNNAINIITIISALSIIAGSAALFIVLSGFSGLKEFSLSFSSVFDPDLKVLPVTGKTFLFSSAEAQKLDSLPGVAQFSKIVEERAFLEFKGKNHVAYIKGVDANYPKVNNVDSTLIFGSWISADEPVAVIGIGINRILSVGINNFNDLLQIMVPKPGTGQITNPSQAFSSSKVLVSGLYQVNEELDDNYVFTSIHFARSLLNYDENQLSSLEIKLVPGVDPEAAAKKVQDLLGENIQVKTRIQLNDKLYKMLNTENLAVYLIFTLVLIIALFNLVGSIIMIVLDKRENIKTLHSLGANYKEIRQVFFLQGAMMTFFGGLLGLLIGLIIVAGQLQFDLVMITPELPYPMQLTFVNCIVVLLTISVLGILASKAAASRVSPKLSE